MRLHADTRCASALQLAPQPMLEHSGCGYSLGLQGEAVMSSCFACANAAAGSAPSLGCIQSAKAWPLHSVQADSDSEQTHSSSIMAQETQGRAHGSRLMNTTVCKGLRTGLVDAEAGSRVGAQVVGARGAARHGAVAQQVGGVDARLPAAGACGARGACAPCGN